MCALACARYARGCTHMCVRTFLNVLAQKLVKTSLSVGYMHVMCALASVRYACEYTHMRACVRSHIFGRICSKICENIPLHVLHTFYVSTCMCTLVCARYARGCTHMRACVRSHIFERISSKIGENIPLRGLHAFNVRTCVCTCVCTLCAHYARACTARICALTHFRTDPLQTWCNILRVTESCMGYFIFTCALACARYAHACTHMSACVRSHIFGCIRSKFGGDIPLHGLHDLYMRTCVCTLCAHYARTISMHVLYCMHVRVHTFLDRFSQNLVEHSTGL
jgi:hypothetical protein